jgi:hypothetical protein
MCGDRKYKLTFGVFFRTSQASNMKTCMNISASSWQMAVVAQATRHSRSGGVFCLSLSKGYEVQEPTINPDRLEASR